MAWTYPYSIANGDPPDAARLQRLLDVARRNINSVTDGEVSGISGGGSPERLHFDPVSGHTHTGTDSSLLALAQNATPILQGSVKVATFSIDVAAISFSTDLVAGTGITRIMGLWVGADTFIGPVNTATTNQNMVSIDVNDGTFYYLIEPAAGADEAYIWNGIASTAGGTADGQVLTYRVFMVGV